jgi:hypothetical protein
MLGACTTTNRRMTDELNADLPQAIGLGAFAPSCVFFCSVTATFTQGDQNAPELLTIDGKVRRKRSLEYTKKPYPVTKGAPP